MQTVPPTATQSSKVGLVLNKQKLEDLRTAHDIASDAELARVIGVSREQLWRVSTGAQQPSSTFIARVLHAFPKASMDSLFQVREMG